MLFVTLSRRASEKPYTWGLHRMGKDSCSSPGSLGSLNLNSFQHIVVLHQAGSLLATFVEIKMQGSN